VQRALVLLLAGLVAGCGDEELVCRPEGRVVTAALELPESGTPALALSSERVYWASRGALIMSAPRTGGDARIEADLSAGSEWVHHAIAIDDDAIYVVAGGGAVLRLPLGGGDPETLAVFDADTSSTPRALARSGDDLYYADVEAVWRVPRTGGAPEQVFAASEPIYAIAVAGDALVVRSNDRMWVHRLDSSAPDVTVTVQGEFEDAPPIIVGDEIYLRVENCWVGSVSLAGGDVVQVSPDDERCVLSFAARPGRLDLGYAIRISDGRYPGPTQPAEYDTLECGGIREVDLDTAVSVDIATSQQLILALAADSSGVFWWSGEDGASSLRAVP